MKPHYIQNHEEEQKENGPLQISKEKFKNRRKLNKRENNSIERKNNQILSNSCLDLSNMISNIDMINSNQIIQKKTLKNEKLKSPFRNDVLSNTE